MIGKRLLQLIVNLTIILACVTSIPVSFRHYVDRSDILMVVVAISLVVPFAVSLKLNWILLKKCKLVIKLSNTSALHFALIALAPVIAYFTTNLRFSYDDHLSNYWLYAIVSDWLWLPEQIIALDIGIVASEVGMYMFVFYVFVAMFIFSMHTLGLFSEEARNGSISRTLLVFQFFTGALLTSFVLFLLYEFCWSIFGFLEALDGDPGLLNTANLGVYFFHAVNLILLSLYGSWVLLDANHLWRWNFGAAPPLHSTPNS